jgi:hypothetical protein
MTWPTTPINTTNLDNGADEPRLARADLKNMADAVNAMINYGDPYNPGSPVPLPTAAWTATLPQFSWNLSIGQRITSLQLGGWTKVYDLIGTPSGLDDYINLAAGKYIIECNLGFFNDNNQSFISLQLVNPFNTSEVFWRNESRAYTASFSTTSSNIVTLTSQKSLDLQLVNFNDSTIASVFQVTGWLVKVTKLPDLA